ncbi:predicted protein [Postia placenta Mad-698-R]|nr:predicted protein [Postia placenta Mad-698-R]
MDMDQPPEYASRLPSTSTFSFTAPFPPPSEASSSNVASALKQRRVSLATNSSPRIVPAWSFRDDTGVGVHSIDSSGLAPEKKGKMRRIESSIDRTDEEGALQPSTEKKPRKKWTMEETQMLVNGCNKANVLNCAIGIPVSERIRCGQRACMQFRTYFPDAYKQHYPNAKTHLSSKIRSALPDGSSIFEKTRSKKRRPFTEEEDRALKAGYDKHGTVWATILPRVTHHSNYAGDLIFGARSHQPQHQPFDYGPGFGFGNAGLGLSGVQPMQLHTPALPGIDEIELTSITLEDQGDVRHPLEEAADTAVLKDDGGASMTLSELGAFGVSPQTFEDIVGFSSELHATPPGTPQSTSRSMRAHSAMHVGSSHNRSISVPPSEHRVAVTRAAQTQVMKTRPLQPPPRSMSLMEMLPVQPADTMASQPQTFQSLQAYATEGWRQQADMYDLPFLDLHYYTSTNNPPATMPVDPNSVFAKPDADILRQGQALDLAETYPNASRTFGLPPSLTQHIPMMSQSASSTPPATTRMLPSHHRGQSAVSPQDLLLRKSSDNKRKRSSWDGGVH